MINYLIIDCIFRFILLVLIIMDYKNLKCFQRGDVRKTLSKRFKVDEEQNQVLNYLSDEEFDQNQAYFIQEFSTLDGNGSTRDLSTLFKLFSHISSAPQSKIYEIGRFMGILRELLNSSPNASFFSGVLACFNALVIREAIDFDIFHDIEFYVFLVNLVGYYPTEICVYPPEYFTNRNINNRLCSIIWSMLENDEKLFDVMPPFEIIDRFSMNIKRPNDLNEEFTNLYLVQFINKYISLYAKRMTPSDVLPVLNFLGIIEIYHTSLYLMISLIINIITNWPELLPDIEEYLTCQILTRICQANDNSEMAVIYYYYSTLAEMGKMKFLQFINFETIRLNYETYYEFEDFLYFFYDFVQIVLSNDIKVLDTFVSYQIVHPNILDNFSGKKMETKEKILQIIFFVFQSDNMNIIAQFINQDLLLIMSDLFDILNPEYCVLLVLISKAIFFLAKKFNDPIILDLVYSTNIISFIEYLSINSDDEYCQKAAQCIINDITNSPSKDQS